MNSHQSNQAFWDASANWWKEKEDHRGLWRKAHENPSSVLSLLEMSFVNNIEGKEVCVLGSGDNEVAFALVGLGGWVTSVDFSQRKLDIARASQLGLQLSFQQIYLPCPAVVSIWFILVAMYPYGYLILRNTILKQFVY